MTEDFLSYPNLIDSAMRGVVRDALRKASASGLPGEHHFFITFLTGYPGVKISETLKARYPREMTIVLQHQFWDFKVEETHFTVTLSFGGVPEKLVIPFQALTAFADPSVKFGLQFQQEAPMDDESLLAQMQPIPEAMNEPLHEDIEEDAPEPAGAEIISIDTFRKK